MEVPPDSPRSISRVRVSGAHGSVAGRPPRRAPGETPMPGGLMQSEITGGSPPNRRLEQTAREDWGMNSLSARRCSGAIR